MNISWGYRVALLYIGFAGFIIFFVTRSMNQKIDLVAKDYYAQELKYQDKIENTNRNNLLDQPLSITLEKNGIRIKYPKSLEGTPLTGSILVFRPSDNSKDKTITILPGADFDQLIPSEMLSKGMYRIKVEYQSGGNNYYSEKQVIVP